MNNNWPDTVPILTVFETFSRQYGSPYEDDYPTDLMGWTEYSFPNHEHRILFWQIYYKAYLIFSRERTHILSLMNISSELQHIAQWNTRMARMWNVAMILLGYTENQSDRSMRVAEYIKSNSFFQKLDAVVGCRNGVYYPIAYYYDNKEVTLNKVNTISRNEFNAEEENNNQEYSTRPTDHRRTTRTTSRSKGFRPQKPNLTGNRTNPALQRLMQARGT